MDKRTEMEMKVDPWKGIDQSLDDLLVKIIMDKHPEILDDDLPDILNNERLVDEAKETIIEKLNS